MPASSVFSSQAIAPNQIAWVMGHFGAEWYLDSWAVPSGESMQVAVTDGTKQITVMPPAIIEPVTQLLGARPATRLSVVSLGQYPQVTWQILELFAHYWPCCWSDHTAQPPIPLWPLRDQPG